MVGLLKNDQRISKQAIQQIQGKLKAVLCKARRSTTFGQGSEFADDYKTQASLGKIWPIWRVPSHDDFTCKRLALSQNAATGYINHENCFVAARISGYQQMFSILIKRTL
jgi:hypothetical protein